MKRDYYVVGQKEYFNCLEKVNWKYKTRGPEKGLLYTELSEFVSLTGTTVSDIVEYCYGDDKHVDIRIGSTDNCILNHCRILNYCEDSDEKIALLDCDEIVESNLYDKDGNRACVLFVYCLEYDITLKEARERYLV